MYIYGPNTSDVCHGKFHYVDFDKLRGTGSKHKLMIRKKEEICLSPMTKAPTPTEKSKKQLDR